MSSLSTREEEEEEGCIGGSLTGGKGSPSSAGPNAMPHNFDNIFYFTIFPSESNRNRFLSTV